MHPLGGHSCSDCRKDLGLSESWSVCGKKSFQLLCFSDGQKSDEKSIIPTTARACMAAVSVQFTDLSVLEY